MLIKKIIILIILSLSLISCSSSEKEIEARNNSSEQIKAEKHIWNKAADEKDISLEETSKVDDDEKKDSSDIKKEYDVEESLEDDLDEIFNLLDDESS